MDVRGKTESRLTAWSSGTDLCSWDGLQGPGQGAGDDVWDTVTNNTLAGSDPLSKLKEERNSGPCP